MANGPKIKDLTGERFGRLVVMYQSGFRYKPCGQRTVLWHCKCDCGTEKDIPASTLKNGRSRSCGCLNSDLASERAYRHGGCTNGKLDRIYKIWRGMKDRCYNKSNINYKEYGGRGITICDEWRDYDAFKEWSLANGYKDGLSIDRIDVNGNYEPSNCRWADAIQQANNTRRNFYITAFGETKTAAQWSRETGVNPHTIICRINLGWDAEKAISEKEDGRVRLVTAFGETKSIADWAKEFGIKYTTLSERIRKYGMSVEEAVKK